jgi:rubredoxin
MQAYNQLQDSSKAGEAWEKIQARHKVFEDLPDDWRCPRCKQPKEKFNPA